LVLLVFKRFGITLTTRRFEGFAKILTYSARLNRWREEQTTCGKHPTYGDLVRQYVALNKMPRFQRIPHGRYINFVADFLKADNGATRAEAITAWNELKELDVPKDYVLWVKARANRKGKSS